MGIGTWNWSPFFLSNQNGENQQKEQSTLFLTIIHLVGRGGNGSGGMEARRLLFHISSPLFWGRKSENALQPRVLILSLFFAVESRWQRSKKLRRTFHHWVELTFIYLFFFTESTAGASNQLISSQTVFIFNHFLCLIECN